MDHVDPPQYCTALPMISIQFSRSQHRLQIRHIGRNRMVRRPVEPSADVHHGPDMRPAAGVEGANKIAPRLDVKNRDPVFPANVVKLRRKVAVAHHGTTKQVNRRTGEESRPTPNGQRYNGPAKGMPRKVEHVAGRLALNSLFNRFFHPAKVAKESGVTQLALSKIEGAKIGITKHVPPSVCPRDGQAGNLDGGEVVNPALRVPAP